MNSRVSHRILVQDKRSSNPVALQCPSVLGLLRQHSVKDRLDEARRRVKAVSLALGGNDHSLLQDLCCAFLSLIHFIFTTL